MTTRNARQYKRRKHYYLTYRYGLTKEQIAFLLEQRNGRCAACGEAETYPATNGGTRDLAIDHCHTTGKIRGLLCHRCNAVLGYCKDSPDLLRRLALYLEVADTGFNVKAGAK